MGQIAKRAGVSKGLAYNYFRSKEEILAAAIEHRLEKSASLSDAAAQRFQEPEKQIKALIEGFLRDIEREPAAFRLYFSLTLQEEASVALRDALERLQPRVSAYLEGLRRLFVALGSSDPDTDALLLRSTLLGLAFRIARSSEPISIEEAGRRLVALFVPVSTSIQGRE